jgi:TRAP-type C4-dicarboxylate transport system permease small subunit
MNSRLIKYLDRFLSFWITTLIGLMTVIVIIAVILRYFFSISFIWSEELVTMLFVGFSFFGCISAVKEKEHIGIDFIVQSFGPQTRQIFKILASVISIIVLAVVIFAAIKWIPVAGTIISPGLQLPYYIFYSIIPVSFILVILYELMSIKDDLDLLYSRRKGIDGR